MIDGSEKRNCKLGFELQSSRVIERRSKTVTLGHVKSKSHEIMLISNSTRQK